MPFASYRAVYDLRIDETSENKGIEGINGRLVYEQTGNACEGFVFNARQVVTIQTENGQSTIDSSNSSFESGDGKTLRFKNQSKANNRIIEETAGEAIIVDGNELQVRLSKPEKEQIQEKGEISLPTSWERKLISSALNGVKLVSSKIYDGTDDGKTSFETFAIIGKRIEPGEGEVEEAARVPELQKLARWPIKTTYFKQDAESVGERVPSYAISAEVYENGINRNVIINYSDFSVKAELKELKFLPVQSCNP
ncbi:DUF1849 family protein [Microvirga sp. W0021]|uniref:DUF1849 family protein n=1 Tax=Hohaiivirga grylli TaxID=3133970 RepID=A0ABV0BKD2_9HYPH